MLALRLLCVACFLVLASMVSAQVTNSTQSAGSRLFRGVCLDSQLGAVLALSGPGGDMGPRVQLAQGENTWSLSVNADGKLQLASNNKPLLSASKGALSVGALSVAGVDTRRVRVNGNAQWALHTLDVFSGGNDTESSMRGWQYKAAEQPGLSEEERKRAVPYLTLECQGLNIYTTPAAPGFVSKSFKRLPKHRFVRVVATVHFVDDWQGETAWLKVDNNYVWTESLDQKTAGAQLNVCGKSQFPESKFSSVVDITLEHTGNNLHVQFGANLEHGSEAFFGISNLQLYVR